MTTELLQQALADLHDLTARVEKLTANLSESNADVLPPLRLCPFCGDSVEAPSVAHGPPYVVTCGNCGCEGPWSKDVTTPAAAILAWNERAE